jgi:hypothetical protein
MSGAENIKRRYFGERKMELEGRFGITDFLFRLSVLIT